jgi:hypothetical protein
MNDFLDSAVAADGGLVGSLHSVDIALLSFGST